MTDDTVLLEIKWTVEDVRQAYYAKYKHNPTDTEVEDILNKIDVKAMEEASIETGWRYIEEAL